MKKSFLLVSLLLVIAMFATACQPPAAAPTPAAPGAAAPAAAPTTAAAPAAKPFRVGLIVATGGLGDRSFNDSGYSGVERAKKELGIQFDYVEPKEIAEYESHERAFAQKQSYDLIVGLGFDQADSMKKVATDFPQQKWLMIDGTIEKMDNVRSVTFKDWEKTFLIGGAAAQLATLPLPKAKSNCTLGGVGGMDIPLIRAFGAGFSAGIKYVNPDCKIVLNYVGGWADPAKGKEIALSMYDQGIDIVYAFAGGSGLGVFQAAKARDKYAIGTDVNQNYIDPDHIVLSAQRYLDVVIYDTIKDLMNGKWEGGYHQLGLKENAVGYTFDQSNVQVPKEIKDKMEEMKAKVISGELVIPDKLEDVDAFVAKLKK
jgi:basic membrane protein A and related proteins